MKVGILTARKVLFEGEAAEVVLPAEDGEMSVLDFHQPCICRLGKGQIKVSGTGRSDGKGNLAFPVRLGVAWAGVQSLTVLVEDA